MRVPIKRTDSAMPTCGGMSPCCLARVTASVNARTSTAPDFSRSFTTSGSSRPNSAMALTPMQPLWRSDLSGGARPPSMASMPAGPDLHRLHQVAGRGGGKALRPEDGHCPLQHFVAIEFSWPHHGRHLTLLWTDVSITIGRGGIGAADGGSADAVG